jgi:hypothetical protein
MGKRPENHCQAISWRDIGGIEKKNRATSRGILLKRKIAPRISPFSNQS